MLSINSKLTAPQQQGFSGGVVVTGRGGCQLALGRLSGIRQNEWLLLTAESGGKRTDTYIEQESGRQSAPRWAWRRVLFMVPCQTVDFAILATRHLRN